MKKIIITFYSLLLLINTGFGQAKKPTIMILPADVWCNDNGFMMEFDNQGTKVKIPNYKKAFQENSDLVNVVSKINGLMADRGFPLKDAASVMKSLESEAAEDAMMTNKGGGGGVAESPIDKLKKTAKADIIMQLTWKLNATGPKKSITFNLAGLDSYTDEQIATAQGTGAPSFSAEVPVLLEEAVLAHIDPFNATLQTYFDDLFANGRKVSIRLKKFDSWEDDFEKEYGGKPLSEVVEDWMNKNSVKSRFHKQDDTENMQYYDMVRIPLYDAGGTKAMDTKGFARDLQKYLEAPPYSIKCKLMTKGLGQATLYLGYNK